MKATARMSLNEFAKAEGMSPTNAANALRADSRLPKHERRYPFITAIPPADSGGKWRYLILRAQYEQWQAGQQTPVVDYEALADAILLRIMARLGAAYMQN